MKSDSDYAIYAYRAVYTQTNAAGGNVVIDIGSDAGNMFEVIYIMTGSDNYAADRSVSYDIVDEDGARVVRLFVLATVDNENCVFPHKGGTADTATLKLMDNLLVASQDFLRLEASALAQNETFTVDVRLKIFNGHILPTIDSSNSTGTVGAPTVTVNRVI